MCGIIGHINLNNRIDIEKGCKALNTMFHRGPDGMGVLFANSNSNERNLFTHSPENDGKSEYDIFLGHRRLSIIDLSDSAAQPMCNENRNVWVVFNGEIYNHIEIRKELENDGHIFRTDHSDTEVLVHGWEKWGADLVHQLNGMFAFAILDIGKRCVFLARDRFGEKPLYYVSNSSGVSFSSELKGIISLGTTQKNISNSSLQSYWGFGYIPAPFTIFDDVKKLQASTYIKISFDQPSLSKPVKYWELDYREGENQPKRIWEQKFEDALARAVETRMMSDVPLGVFLSGGLDSTIILKYMRKTLREKILAFTIGFKEKSHDESKYAKIAASKYKAIHEIRYLKEKELLEALPKIEKQFDEPFADSSIIPTYLVSRLAKEHVKVSLSGDAGDEMLAGYRRYKYNYLAGRFMEYMPDFINSSVINQLANRWPDNLRGKGFAKYLNKYEYPTYIISLWDEYFLGPKVNPLQFLSKSMHIGKDINSMCHFDVNYYLPEDILVKVDRASMAVSLESRAPLLDHRLFELAAKMPLSLKHNGYEGKLIFKKALQKEMSRDFIRRKKKGFSVPIGKWFRNELLSELKDSTKIISENSDIDKTTIFKLIENHKKGGRDQSARLWKLFVWKIWCENYK